jgi:hypothetical protein
MQRMSAEQFKKAISGGQTAFNAVIVTSTVEIRDLRIQNDLDLRGLTVEGDLIIENVFVTGTLRFSGVKARNINVINFNARSYD